MKKFFKSLFRKENSGSINTESSPPADTTTVATETSKADYYIGLLNASNQKALYKKKHFMKVLQHAPSEKILVFFNIQFLETLSEKEFIELDEYLHSKEAQEGSTFYRGLRHSPCVIHAFASKHIPEDFYDGKLFLGCPALVLYL